MRELARRADEYTYLQHSIHEATARMKQLDSVLLGVETELRRAESSLVRGIPLTSLIPSILHAGGCWRDSRHQAGPGRCGIRRYAVLGPMRTMLIHAANMDVADVVGYAQLISVHHGIAAPRSSQGLSCDASAHLRSSHLVSYLTAHMFKPYPQLSDISKSSLPSLASLLCVRFDDVSERHAGTAAVVRVDLPSTTRSAAASDALGVDVMSDDDDLA